MNTSINIYPPQASLDDLEGSLNVFSEENSPRWEDDMHRVFYRERLKELIATDERFGHDGLGVDVFEYAFINPNPPLLELIMTLDRLKHVLNDAEVALILKKYQNLKKRLAVEHFEQRDACKVLDAVLAWLNSPSFTYKLDVHSAPELVLKDAGYCAPIADFLACVLEELGFPEIYFRYSSTHKQVLLKLPKDYWVVDPNNGQIVSTILEPEDVPLQQFKKFKQAQIRETIFDRSIPPNERLTVEKESSQSFVSVLHIMGKIRTAIFGRRKYTDGFSGNKKGDGGFSIHPLLSLLKSFMAHGSPRSSSTSSRVAAGVAGTPTGLGVSGATLLLGALILSQAECDHEEPLEPKMTEAPKSDTQNPDLKTSKPLERARAQEASDREEACTTEQFALIDDIRNAVPLDTRELWYIPKGDSYEILNNDFTFTPIVKISGDKLTTATLNSCLSLDDNPGLKFSQFYFFTYQGFSSDTTYIVTGEDSDGDRSNDSPTRFDYLRGLYALIESRQNSYSDSGLDVSTIYIVHAASYDPYSYRWEKFRKADLEARKGFTEDDYEKMPNTHLKIINFDHLGRLNVEYELAKDLVDKP